jgi:hypothetical protein
MDGASAADSIFSILGVDAATLADSIRTAADSDSILAQIAALVNLAALVAAVLFQGAHLAAAVLQQGQHGVVAGKYSLPWAILRTILLYSMLMPLGSGYSLIQAAILWLGMSGSGLADNAWDRSNSYLMQRMQLAAPLPPRHLQQIAGPLAVVEACSLGIERAAAGGGGGTISNVSVARPSTWATSDTEHEAVRQLSYDGAGDLPAKALCGAITLRRELPQAGDSVEARALRAIALRSLELQQQDLLSARAAVRQLLERRFAGELAGAAFRAEMLAIETRYMQRQGRQALALNRDLAPLEIELREAQMQQAQGAGWLFAGAFYMTMSAYDDKLNEAVFWPPSFAGPRMSEMPRSLVLDVRPFVDAARALTPTGALGDAEPNAVVQAQLEAEHARRLQLRTQALKQQLTPDNRAGFATRAWLHSDFEGLAILQNKAADLGAEILAEFSELGRGDGRGFVPRLVGIGHSILNGAGILLAGSTIGGMTTLALLLPLALIFAAAGVLLAYLLPALPLIIWIAGIAGWLLMLCQAVLGATLWAATHADPRGEGFSTNRARPGYMLLFALIARPLLLLAGFIAAMLLLEFLGHFIFQAFAAWHGVQDQTGAGTGLVGSLATILLICVMIAVIARWSFSLILQVPDSVLRWIGGAATAVGESEMAEEARTMALGALAKIPGASAALPLAGLGKGPGKGLIAK